MQFQTPDWSPFQVADPQSPLRPLPSVQGIGDRLRCAAFAEVQAAAAFRWAVERFADVAPVVKEAWLVLAREEDKHRQ